MAQQTAVEWLIKRYQDYGKLYYEDMTQAKAIEKEQILNACQHFADYPFDEDDVKQYYNETYSDGKKD
jgi:hypothetical protein